MASRWEDVIPRPVLVLLLILTATLGAVEATPKEVAVSLSTEPFSASPLSTLPTGTSILARELARAGYDVRVYADVSDLVVDAPRRVVVVAVSPERVSRAQADLLASYASRADYFGVLIADERMEVSGSSNLAREILGLCGLSTTPSGGLPEGEALGVLYLGSWGESPVALMPLATASPVILGGRLDVPPLLGGAEAPPAPPYARVVDEVRVEVYGFVYSRGAWRPLSYVVKCPEGRYGLAIAGDGDLARNYMVNASVNYLAHAFALLEEVAGPPSKNVTVAFIISFYLGESLKLSTVLHPSFLLSLAGQVYTALEHGFTSRLTVGQAAILVAVSSAAAGLASLSYAAALRGSRVQREGGGGPGRREVLESARLACQSGRIPGALVGARCMPGILARVWYSIVGWDRFYAKILKKAGGR